jgi:carboxymethylenebutenolidase
LFISSLNNDTGGFMNRDEMVELWENHAFYEFGVKDAGLAISTMVADASVMHLPTMSGGFGRAQLRRYYADVFIPGIPEGTSSELISRSVGDDFLVDELIMSMCHDREIPFLLPRLEPTGRTVEVAFVVIVTFRDSLMETERLYWDQAGLLSQLGLISRNELPVAEFSKVADFLRKGKDGYLKARRVQREHIADIS